MNSIFNKRCLFVFAFLMLASVVAKYPTCNADDDRPNILFCITDDQSYPYASIYGCTGIQTPAFDQIAKEGALFTNSYCGSPGCSPPRAAFLTGRYPWQIEHAGTHASDFPIKYVLYTDLLEEAGYFVGYTGKGWGPGNYKSMGRTRNPAGPEFSSQNEKAPYSGISNKNYAANFKEFLAKSPEDQPFCFWYGAHEPHRSFEKGSGLKAGKKLADAAVPAFLPDTPEIRSDILDYCVEIEHADQHLGQMIALLKEQGKYENTLIVVTSDNGMAFPRAKANCYEYGVHLPLAISWPKKFSGGRTIDDVVSHTDFAPTFLEAAGLEKHKQMVGHSLLPLLEADKEGFVDSDRIAVFSARERHSSSRYNNLAYPQRVVRSGQFLLIRNFRPERWPAGAPQKFDKPNELGPMHGGYHDIDASPSLSFLIDQRNDPVIGRFFHLSVDHRPEIEFFDVKNDPACLKNLADDPQYGDAKLNVLNRLDRFLRETEDPRIIDGGDIFETYRRVSRMRSFPAPAWAKEK